MAPPRPSLVIADGDLPGLLACAAAARGDELTGSTGSAGGSGRRSGSALWFPAPLDADRRDAARRHADLYGLAVVDSPDEPEPTGVARTSDDGPGATHLLLDAAECARSAGLDGVVWPIHAGETLDLDRVARAVDRALLVSRLVALDAPAEGRGAVGIDAPYADFTDEQVAELALDMDLPAPTCWWWSGGGARGAAARERWLIALRAVGWTELPAADVTLRMERAKRAAI